MLETKQQGQGLLCVCVCDCVREPLGIEIGICLLLIMMNLH